nr:DUF4105 domain-containing protein [Roseivirga sp. E12]
MIFSFKLSAQFGRLSDQAEVSIITVGPGANLYDCFGHSAFRIIDPSKGLDRAYNYGQFDFTEGGFVAKFSMGVAQYRLGAYPFERFYNNYVQENRWLTEQVLNLSLEEKQAIYEALETNYLPENRKYVYDPFFDNCATRMRDIVKEVMGDAILYNSDHLTKTSTIRSLVDENSYNHPWVDFGIDVALGTIIDKKATPEQYMYLPDYVLAAYANATILRDGRAVPAVKQTNKLFESDYYEVRQEKMSPTLLFVVVAVVLIVFTVRDYMKGGRSRFLDFGIMFLTGLLGAFLIFLWFFTYHKTTVNNLNILWAFLPNIVVAFYLIKRETPKWVRVYVRFLFILLIAMAFVWILRLQVFNTAMLPIMVLLGVRYGYLWQKGLTKS